VRIPCGEARVQAVLFAPMMVDSRRDAGGASASRADGAMERYARGDEAAFADLYDDIAPRLHRFALRWTRSESAAEDVVQQTLLQMHGARHRFAPGAAVVPWAYAIARRLLVDLSRRRAREEVRADPVADIEEASPSRSPEDALDGMRAEAAARRDLALLRPAWREAFELVKLEGLAVAEAAEALGITRGMVKIRVHRATAALREAMARRLRDDPAQAASPAARQGRAADTTGGGVPT
jgi:RNA polymerase sigma factor (sigma-70 family)